MCTLLIPLEKTAVFCIIGNKFNHLRKRSTYFMAQPKKQTSARKTGLRRSHLRLKLARAVNAKSPVKVHTTKRETGAKKAA
jgi:ribosomal protein L32